MRVKIIKCYVPFGTDMMIAAQELIVLAQELIPPGSRAILQIENLSVGNPVPKTPLTIKVGRKTTYVNILRQMGLAHQCYIDGAPDEMPDESTVYISDN